jgi:methionyl-tRNA formyltransferase
MEKLRIVFMEHQICRWHFYYNQNNYTVVRVITAADKPAGRGQN